MEEPAKIEEIKFLMSKDGGLLSGQEARAKVYGTQDDQTRLFESFVKLYGQPDEFGEMPAPEIALQNALKAIRIWVGDEIDPGLQKRIDEFLTGISSPDVTGGTTGDPALDTIITGN